MSINLVQRVGRKVATKILGRKTVQAVKKVGDPSNDLKSKYFHAVARNEMARTTALHDVEYVVYYGEKNSESHYDMWNPVFSENPNSYISITRFTATWWEINEEPNVYPISSINQIEPLFARMPNLKAVFYPANNGVNMQAIRNNNLTHVFLGHGDSNKASSANKVFRLYDEVWVAGQAHLDRFKRVPGDYSALKFKVVGQPWMKDWLNALPDYAVEERTAWGYFPTWRGYYKNTNYSSLDLAKGIADAALECLSKDSIGFLKLHPWSSVDDVECIDEIRMSYIPKKVKHVRPELAAGEEQAALDLDNSRLKRPDVGTQLRDVLKEPLRFVLCDISASVTECLYTNVPIFLYYPRPPALLADDFETQNAFCYLYRDVDELRQLLKRVITDEDDYLADKRIEALNYYVNIEHTKNGQFHDTLKQLPKPTHLS
jgi:hypothetical protein